MSDDFKKPKLLYDMAHIETDFVVSVGVLEHFHVVKIFALTV